MSTIRNYNHFLIIVLCLTPYQQYSSHGLSIIYTYICLLHRQIINKWMFNQKLIVSCHSVESTCITTAKYRNDLTYWPWFPTMPNWNWNTEKCETVKNGTMLNEYSAFARLYPPSIRQVFRVEFPSLIMMPTSYLLFWRKEFTCNSLLEKSNSEHDFWKSRQAFATK